MCLTFGNEIGYFQTPTFCSSERSQRDLSFIGEGLVEIIHTNPFPLGRKQNQWGKDYLNPNLRNEVGVREMLNINNPRLDSMILGFWD